MAQSSNPVVQDLMNQVESIDPNAPNIEDTLQRLAEAVALEQQKNQQQNSGGSGFAPIDPQDAFQCEGCQ